LKALDGNTGLSWLNGSSFEKRHPSHMTYFSQRQEVSSQHRIQIFNMCYLLSCM